MSDSNSTLQSDPRQTETEEWRWIPGYEERYQVSNLGRVKSFLRDKTKGYYLRPSYHKGYPHVTLCKFSNPPKRFRVHVLVALTFMGPRPTGKDINHINGVKTDNRPCNLEYVTRQYNLQHAKVNGLNRVTYLTEIQVRQIFELRLIHKYLVREIVQELHLNVRECSVYQVLNRKTWKHVDIQDIINQIKSSS